MIELHIYGPALGLPSIDSGCLAAIAILQSTISPNEWILVPSNDPSVSPFGGFPALKVGDETSQIWIAGFRNIVAYIESDETVSRLSENQATLRFGLDNQQNADAEAYLSFLESRGLPLLDLSLYVSSDNYTTITRSALSDLVPWPQSWIIPQRLRDAARKRSEHLGLSGLDVDAIREQELKKENEGLSATIPKSLRLPKKSVTSLLGSAAEQTRFRLEAVTADFFEPLEELLGDKKYFLGDEMTVLDCFALALLSQMSFGDLPQPWLSEALEKHPKLHSWTVENRSRLFEPASQLPWKTVAERSWTRLVQDVANSIAESLPISIIRSPDRKSSLESDHIGETKRSILSKSERKHLFHAKQRNRRNTVRGVVAACVSSAGLVGALLYTGILTLRWPALRRTQPATQTFGQAGSFLGLG